MARFCPLFSGSSGNCLYIGTPDSGILIDGGVSARRMEQALRDRDIDPRRIQAIFVTHEHTDHTAGLRVFQKRFGTAVYASAGTRDGLYETEALDGAGVCLPMDGRVELDDFAVKAFAISHDCRQGTGFRITLRDGRTVGVATDMGEITDTVREYLTGCDLIHIESNHDVRMLENGPYPYPLKRRILSPIGHLSNEACARELPRLIETGTTRIFLGHLSRENNLPWLAHAASQSALQMAGFQEQVDYLLRVAPPENDQPPLIF